MGPNLVKVAEIVVVGYFAPDGNWGDWLKMSSWIPSGDC